MRPLLVKEQREEDTAAWKIFHESWPCSIPRAFTVDRKKGNLVAQYTTGDRDIDEETAMEQVRTSLPISKLAELLEMGCEPNILKPTQNVPKMIALIDVHTSEITSLYDYGHDSQIYVPSEEDLERVERAYADLRLLSDLVTYLEDLPRDETGPDPRPEKIRSSIERFMTFRRKSKTAEEIRNRVAPKEANKPVKSMSEVIAERIGKRNNR